MAEKQSAPVGLDPRYAPVVAVDGVLPAVEQSRLTTHSLRARFLTPPVWEPELRSEPRFTQREPTHASVLIPVVLRDEPTVLLTQRTQRLSSHSGQVAFPGGKADASDADVIATALREAHEEVGLQPADVEVLGSLPHYRTGSGFIVTPVFGLVAAHARWRANPDEVAHVFEVPLQFLMDPANHRRHQMEWEGVVREWYSMPYQDGPQEWFIWGATAGILRNLYRFLSA